MSHEQCNDIGASGEAAVASELTAAGFCVYVPVFRSPTTDLVAERNGHLIRVQVKTLAGDEPVLRFMCRTPATDTYIGAAEWMALHSTHYGVTAFLKPEEAGVRPTIRYVMTDHPEKCNTISEIRYASDYTIDRVIKETET